METKLHEICEHDFQDEVFEYDLDGYQIPEGGGPEIIDYEYL